jgi:hypothetical protein
VQIFIWEEAEMLSTTTRSVIDRARRLYTEQLQSLLESEHRDRYVAIEPDSGDYFLGDTLDKTVKLARTKYPSRLTYTIWIGHRAVFHLGVMQQCPAPQLMGDHTSPPLTLP